MKTLPPDLEIFITNDQSPTLSFLRTDGYGEKMHHSGGALSESVYIYHGVLLDLLARGWPPRVFSFGLGLGYNELLTIAELTKRGIPDWKIYSFEALPVLRDGFRSWLEGDFAHALSPILDQVLAQVGQRLNIEVARVKAEALAGLRDGRLEVRGPFPDDSLSVTECHLVYYDAFSNKMNTGPWTEEGLRNDLGRCLASRCLFTTYAVTGNLKRGLKSMGFQLIPRVGFEGKRESTLAIRE